MRIYNEDHRIVTMLTSHYMQDIEALCHRVIIIDHGKIFFDGPLSRIIDRFSGHKILSLTFEVPVTQDFSPFGEVIEQTPVSVQLKVPRAKVTETCRQLLEACNVSDINVQELPVEEVDSPALRGEEHAGSAHDQGRRDDRLADLAADGAPQFMGVAGLNLKGSPHLRHLHLFVVGMFHEPGGDQGVQGVR